MFKGLKFFGLAAIFVCSIGAQAFAQAPGAGCIVVKTTAEVEQEVVNAKGEKTKQLHNR